MKAIKIAAVLAGSFLVVLLILIAKVKNPETALYEKTVKTLMQQEGINSQQEIEQRFPVLMEIQADMKEIAEMNRFILNTTRNPVPMISEAEIQQLKYYRQRTHQLQHNVRTTLSQLTVTYADGQSSEN